MRFWFSAGVPSAECRWTGWFALWGFIAGALGVVLAVALFYTVIITTLPADIDTELERTATIALSLAHLPLALLEGLFTALLVSYLRRVKPELIEGTFGRNRTRVDTPAGQPEFVAPVHRATVPRRIVRTPAPQTLRRGPVSTSMPISIRPFTVGP